VCSVSFLPLFLFFPLAHWLQEERQASLSPAVSRGSQPSVHARFVV
jgi:hypothetical protein